MNVINLTDDDFDKYGEIISSYIPLQRSETVTNE